MTKKEQTGRYDNSSQNETGGKFYDEYVLGREICHGCNVDDGNTKDVLFQRDKRYLDQRIDRGNDGMFNELRCCIVVSAYKITDTIWDL